MRPARDHRFNVPTRIKVEARLGVIAASRITAGSPSGHSTINSTMASSASAAIAPLTNPLP